MENKIPPEFLKIYQTADEETKMKLALLGYVHVKNLLGGLIEAIRKTLEEDHHGEKK